MIPGSQGEDGVVDSERRGSGEGAISAVRNLIRAGISETVAMKLTGHRTRHVFQRYAIVEEGMLQEAGEKLVAAAAMQPKASRGRVAELRG